VVIGQTFAEPEHRWGELAVDPAGHNLPALKIARILEALPPAPERLRILDYGCGEGKLLRSLASHRALEPYGADVQRPLRSNDYTFFHLPDEAAAIPRSSFDVVTSVDVLEHVPDLNATLDTISACLKPGGLFCGFVPTEGEPLSLYGVYRALLGRDLYARTKEHVVAYRRRQVLDALRARFEIVALSYSYHVVGGALDATFFALCRIPAVARWWWSSNTYYRPDAKPSLASRAMESANALAYWEAVRLARTPQFSVGLHFTARKVSPA
jgi:SAM-dependent methyltransferase